MSNNDSSNNNEKHWRCFHCDAVFYDRKAAATHFGYDESRDPACILASSTKHLIDYVRKLEAELNSYRSESDHLTQAIIAAESDKFYAIRVAEETGFSKGVKETIEMYLQGKIRELLGNNDEECSSS